MRKRGGRGRRVEERGEVPRLARPPCQKSLFPRQPSKGCSCSWDQHPSAPKRCAMRPEPQPQGERLAVHAPLKSGKFNYSRVEQTLSQFTALVYERQILTSWDRHFLFFGWHAPVAGKSLFSLVPSWISYNNVVAVFATGGTLSSLVLIDNRP